MKARRWDLSGGDGRGGREGLWGPQEDKGGKRPGPRGKEAGQPGGPGHRGLSPLCPSHEASCSPGSRFSVEAVERLGEVEGPTLPYPGVHGPGSRALRTSTSAWAREPRGLGTAHSPACDGQLFPSL